MSIAISLSVKLWLRIIASVLAIRFPWLTLTNRGTPVDPEVAINAARSKYTNLVSAAHGRASRTAQDIATTHGYTTAFQVGAIIALLGLIGTVFVGFGFLALTSANHCIP